MLSKILGANWKTTVSAAGTSLLAAITLLSQMSYDQGPIATVIPAKYKSKVTLISGICTVILWFYNGIQQKSKDVTGGTIKQDAKGNAISST